MMQTTLLDMGFRVHTVVLPLKQTDSPPSNPVASDCEQKQLTLDEVFEIQAFVRQVKIEHAGMELADYQSTPLRDWSSEDHFDWWCYHHRRCARHRALCRASMAPRCC